MNKFESIKYPAFDRKFFDSSDDFTCIGSGAIGGKASGLAYIKNIIETQVDAKLFPSIELNIPRFTVITTSHFDSFMKRNNLYEVVNSGLSDEHIAMKFQNSSLPAEIVGDLRALIEKVTSPLAIRSSSLLEDQKDEPFAGIYATKMIHNKYKSPDERFRKLTEAIKFVYASTFFKAAKDYLAATKYSPEEEKMAVIIQEVVGEENNHRFYPTFSGVARSYNYYPMGRCKPEQGVVNLALGLGKTIVNGDISWSYSPQYPKISPPYAGLNDLMKNTQTTFWAINTGKNADYNPLIEDEYLINLSITEAEKDGVVKHIASTYDREADRLSMGVFNDGTRIIDFSSLLQLNMYNFNNLIKQLLKVCEEAVKNPVEIEFATTINKKTDTLRFGFLQVRPMHVSSTVIEIADDEMKSGNILAASERVIGNGIIENIKDIVFVKPEVFETKFTKKISSEVEELNKKLKIENKPYLLIGFGRWGSSDPWLGIPVDWGQIAGAKVILEATLPGIDVDLSQGSHFFHNLTSFKVAYFSIHHSGKYKINWDWLNSQNIVEDRTFVRHVNLKNVLKIKVDGRQSKGVILYEF